MSKRVRKLTKAVLFYRLPLPVLIAIAVLLPPLTGFVFSYVAQNAPVATHTADSVAGVVYRDGAWRLQKLEAVRDGVLRVKCREYTATCGLCVVSRSRLVEAAPIEGLNASVPAASDLATAQALAFTMITTSPPCDPAFMDNALRNSPVIEERFYFTRCLAGLTAQPLIGLIAVLLALAPLGLAAADWVRRKGWLAAGQCFWCGYDRDGLSDATVCPECGKPQRSPP